MAERMANDLERFNGDIGDYNNYFNNLVNHFQDMVDHMNALNSMWEGEAHNEFLQTFEVDKQQTQIMVDDFRVIMEELRYAHNQYTDCENNVANMINQMPI